ncbi:MAG: hypothetical protein ACE5PT_02780 [Gemmatimonadales bacterium]
MFADDRPRFSSVVGDQVGWVWVRGFSTSWEREEYTLGLQRDGLDVQSVVLLDLVRY